MRESPESGKRIDWSERMEIEVSPERIFYPNGAVRKDYKIEEQLVVENSYIEEGYPGVTPLVRTQIEKILASFNPQPIVRVSEPPIKLNQQDGASLDSILKRR